MRLAGYLIFLTFIYFCSCATYNFYPSNTTFATQLNSLALVGGDIVNFRAATNGGSATYDLAAFASTYTWKGQQNNPIIIRAYPGDKIILTSSNPNANILQLAGSYWRFTGFEIIGHSSARDSIALRLMANTNHVVVDSLKVHDLYQNAITANAGGADYNNITFRGNEVWNTADTGECFYFGCQKGSTACQMHDSLVENNYCHDTCLGGGNTQCTGGSLGSGYQVKWGSYNNIVRNNVCYNTYSPCILLYDDLDKGRNLVEGNLIISTSGDHGIQVSAGAVIRNNIVLGSAGSGIYISDNTNNLKDGSGIRNLLIEHNTLVGNKVYGIKFQSTPTSTTVRNNAVLNNLPGDFFSSSQSGVTWSRNAYTSGSVPPNVNTNGTFLVGTSELISDTTNPYPKTGSILINGGSQSGLAYDYNNRARSGCSPTVGAYEYSTASNPGTIIAKTFKNVVEIVKSCSLVSPCPITCSPSTLPTTAPVTTQPKPATSIPATTQPVPTTTAPIQKQNLNTLAKIKNALNNAIAGDVITIATGTYTFTAGFTIANKGAATVKPVTGNTVKIIFNSNTLSDGFTINNSHGWTFEGLNIEGACSNISNCDSAFHVKSNNVVFRNNVLKNFNKQIKTSGTTSNGLIVGNTFSDNVARQLGFYKVDITQGNGWTIKGNLFRDFYSTDADSLVGGIVVRTYNKVTIDSNLIVGRKTGTTLGIVLKSGEGVTSITNNIITSTTDVGIYMETVKKAEIYNNIIYDTVGIDSRFTGSFAIVKNNIYSGRVRDRDSATTSQLSNNLVGTTSTDISGYFIDAAALNFKLSTSGVSATNDKGVSVSLTTDFCSNTRALTYDIGIFDQSKSGCDTTKPFNVANPSARALVTSSNNSNNTTNNKKDNNVAVYIIIGICCFVAVTTIVVLVVIAYRRNKKVQSLEEPLLDKN